MANVTAALVEELIPTEQIVNFIDGYGYPALTALFVAAAMPSVGSIPVRMPRWNQITPTAGTKTEGSGFAEVTIDTTEETITPGIVGMEVPITDEAKAGAIIGVPEGLLIEGIAAMANRMDVDGHAVSTSATNSQGAVTDVFNRAKVNAAMASYRALSIPNGFRHALVVGNGGFRDLEADSILESATKEMGFAAFSADSGYKGTYGGLDLFLTQNIATEGAGRSCYITPVGNGRSGLGYAITQRIVVESNRGSEGARSARDFHVFRAWYGTGLRNRTRILEVLARP